MPPFFHSLTRWTGQTQQFWEIDLFYCSDKKGIFLSKIFCNRNSFQDEIIVCAYLNQSSTLVGKFDSVLNTMTGLPSSSWVLLLQSAWENKDPEYMVPRGSYRPSAPADSKWSCILFRALPALNTQWTLSST